MHWTLLLPFLSLRDLYLLRFLCRELSVLCKEELDRRKMRRSTLGVFDHPDDERDLEWKFACPHVRTDLILKHARVPQFRAELVCAACAGIPYLVTHEAVKHLYLLDTKLATPYLPPLKLWRVRPVREIAPNVVVTTYTAKKKVDYYRKTDVDWFIASVLVL